MRATPPDAAVRAASAAIAPSSSSHTPRPPPPVGALPPPEAPIAEALADHRLGVGAAGRSRLLLEGVVPAGRPLHVRVARRPRGARGRRLGRLQRDELVQAEPE